MWSVTHGSLLRYGVVSHSEVPYAAKPKKPTSVATKCAARCGVLEKSLRTLGTTRKAMACTRQRPPSRVPTSVRASLERPNDLSVRVKVRARWFR